MASELEFTHQFLFKFLIAGFIIIDKLPSLIDPILPVINILHSIKFGKTKTCWRVLQKQQKQNRKLDNKAASGQSLG